MEIKIIGIDLAKTSFYIHAADAHGRMLMRKKVDRKDLTGLLQGISACVIAMEACGSAHFWGRKFRKMGHTIKLIAPKYVKPFVKSQKNDRNDAEAIVEAALRPAMRFVPLKTLEQQDLQCLQRTRQNLVSQRTALVNITRGLMSEYGVIAPKGYDKFMQSVPTHLEDANNDLTEVMRSLIQENYEAIKNLKKNQVAVEKKIEALAKENPHYERLLSVPGVGPNIAAAFISAVSNANEFKNGRSLSAWIGLVPKQYSTGGISKLGSISKAGDNHLRALLIHGARSLIVSALKKQAPGEMWDWIRKLHEKKGWNKTAVAIANKNCRIIWHLMKYEENFDFKAC